MHGRTIRERHYYKVPKAGAKIGLKRSQAYEAAKAGLIPTEQDGRLLLVPKKRWDAEVRRRKAHKPRVKGQPTTTEVTTA
jgi:hypothetical protein